jgi:hypothetical protein
MLKHDTAYILKLNVHEQSCHSQVIISEHQVEQLIVRSAIILHYKPPVDTGVVKSKSNQHSAHKEASEHENRLSFSRWVLRRSGANTYAHATFAPATSISSAASSLLAPPLLIYFTHASYPAAVCMLQRCTATARINTSCSTEQSEWYATECSASFTACHSTCYAACN